MSWILSPQRRRSFCVSLAAGSALASLPLLASPCVPPADAVRWTLDVQFVRTANDDGGKPSTLTEADALVAIQALNNVWARNGGDIRFRLFTGTQFGEPIRNTLLNNDCILQPGMNSRTVSQLTNPDLDGDGAATDQDRNVICDYEQPKIARTIYALARANRIVVYSRGGNDTVKFDGDVGRWVLGKKSGGASSALGTYVQMPASFGGGTLLAHEVGHYMHAAHPFGARPKSISEARDLMEDWAANHPGDDPRAVFDRDTRVTFAIHDTPPDPGTALFEAVHDESCDPLLSTVAVPVTLDGTTTTVHLTPDRHNVMSYFKGCSGFDHQLSHCQLEQARKALLVGNRQSLIESGGSGCYGSAPGQPEVPRRPSGLTLQDLKDAARQIAACTLWAQRPMPWELVTGDIYINPADAVAGYVLRGDIAVHEAREAALIDALLADVMVE